MRQLTYTLRFTGTATPIGVDGNILQIAASGPGCTIQSDVSADGLHGWLHPHAGDEATLESELVFTGATTFQEIGRIAFGTDGHALRFSTLGTAHLDPVRNDGCRHGAAIWRIDGGDGQLAGTHGLILSAFVLDGDGGVTDHQLGILYVR